MSTNDPVGLALASLGAGTTAGAAVLTGGILVLRTVQRAGMAAEGSDTGFTVLTISTLTGIVTAVAVGWARSRALDDTWRRGVIGMLSVFGMALLAGITVPAELVGGRVGLAIYLAVLVMAFAAVNRQARAAARK